MEFAIYSRKSKQTAKGESIQNQIDYCKKYIVNHFGEGQQIHLFVDEGYSGKNSQRPQFQQMLSLAKQKKLDYIVCYRLDRISRNVGDFAALIQQLSAWETAFVCVQEQFDTATPTGRAMMYLASVFAQLERETIGERVRDNMFYLAKKGYWLGGTFPLGFVSKRVIEKGHSYCHLVQQQDEIKIVQKIYALFLEYGSLSAVKRELQKNGIYSRKGNVFSVMAIKQILTNPVYCKADHAAKEYFLQKGAEVTFLECSEQYGLMVYNKRNYRKKAAPRQNIDCWIVAMGKQQGTIAGEIWVSIQKRLQRNSPKTKEHKTENDYALLSGLLYCQNCGQKMQAKKRRNGNTFDYICRGKLQGKGCTIQNLQGKQTDMQTEKLLLEYIQKNNHFAEVLKKWQKDSNAANYIQKEILSCQNQIQNYIQLLGNTKINDIVLKEVNNKVEKLQKQQKTLQKQQELLQKQTFFAQKEQNCFEILWQKMSIRQKQEALRFLIQKGIWNGTQLQYFL